MTFEMISPPVPESLQNEPCPLLPGIRHPVTAADSRALGEERGEAFYKLCLEYAQTKWIAGLPAQSLLQLNRAMSADLRSDEEFLVAYPMPYAQVAWILKARPDRKGQFLANPRRHWQHYATRMSGARSEIRTWRAWACYAIASRFLPHPEFPHDIEQVKSENLVIPDEHTIGRMLGELGLCGESEVWQLALK